jgi:hypothetical protein
MGSGTNRQALRLIALRRSDGRCRFVFVFLFRHVVAPRDWAALIVRLLHRGMAHAPIGRRAVPVILARLEEDAVAGANHLDGLAAALAEADALGDVDCLAVRMGTPCGAGARREVDDRCAHARRRRLTPFVPQSGPGPSLASAIALI